MTGPFTLSPLPYELDALEPVIGARTMEFHYRKHHQGYVDALNKLVAATRFDDTTLEFADMTLEEVVRATAGKKTETENAIFNSAGQVWNHDFYWRSLSPKATVPGGALARAIRRDFGDAGALIDQFAAAGAKQFGSGWAWLVSKDGKLSVETTANATDPMARGVNCLLTVDVWEHAYYLDYQNERAKYLQTVLSKLLNWDFAAENFAKEEHALRAAAE